MPLRTRFISRLIAPIRGRATVYNNLHALVKAGLIREVAVDGKAVRFDANLERHHHFVCERCGRVEDIAWFDLPPLGRRSPLGRRIIRNYQVVFRGICQHCSERLPRASSAGSTQNNTTEEKNMGKVARQVVEQAGVNVDV